MADELKLTINLDTKSVEQGFEKVEKASDNTSKKIANNLDNSTDKFTEELAVLSRGFGIAAAGVAALGVAVKKTFDFALLGEATKAVETRFNALASSAGIAADRLKEGITAATDGLIDDEEALQIASRGIVAFGKEAERLPQILEASRSVSRALGTDLKESFEQFSTFIQTGNERALRQFGIVLDLNKAYKQYAESIGTTVAQLSDQDKQTVRINLLLEESTAKFSGLTASATPLKDSLDRLKVSIGNLAEDSAVAFNTKFGPALQNIINGISNLIKEGPSLGQIATLLLSPGQAIANLARNSDNASLSVEQLKEKIAKSTAEVSKYEDQLLSLQETNKGDVFSTTAIDRTNAKLLEARKNLNEYFKQLSQKLPDGDQGVLPTRENPKIRPQAEAITQFLLQEELKRQQGIIQIKQIEASQLKTIDEQVIENKKILDLQFEAAKTQQQINLASIDKQFADRAVFTEEEKNLARLESEKTYQQNLALLREQSEANEASLNAKREAQNQKLVKSLQDVGKEAKQNIGLAFSNSIGAAVNALARGEDGIDAFLKSALGGIADLAIQYGSLFLIQAAGFSVIPGLQASGSALFASGLGLLALGGVLKALSGGESETSPVGSTGGGITATPSPTTELVPPAQLERTEPQTAVQLIVQGDIFDSDSTATRLTDLLNDAFDKKGVVIQRGAFA